MEKINVVDSQNTSTNVTDLPQNKIVTPLEVPSDKAVMPGKSHKNLRVVAISTLIILVLVLAIGFVFIYLPVMKLVSSAKTLQASAKVTYGYIKDQDIAKVEESIQKLKSDLNQVKTDFAVLAWTKNIPFVGSYTSDGQHLLSAADHGLKASDIAVKAILPYTDLLGLKGKSTFSGGTTEDRIVKAVETLDKVTPQIDEISAELDAVKKEVDYIDPNRYPETFNGRAIRSQVQEGKKILTAVDSFLFEARPMVKKIGSLLGVNKNNEAKYIILFQNDKELRPTGGFITAYAVFRVEKGKIHLEASDDIYKLDDTVTKKVTPPSPISKYLNVFGWRLRDSNFSPDFNSSMKVFEDLYGSSTQKKTIDGIIAVDTHVLVKLLDVVGPIQAYSTTFTTKKVPQCDCPMIIYELEKYADEPKGYERGSRKDIIGVLLSEVLRKTLTSPKTLLGNLVPAMMDEIKQKHTLFYFKDADAQQGMEALNFAGRIKVAPANFDYLHVNDANLGGAKSNLYIKSKVTLTVDKAAGKNTNNLVLEYQHPRAPDNCSLERKEGLCLSGIYRDYVRVYLPLGSVLVESRGFENHSTTFDDLGHTVVDGFFTVTPLALAKIQIKYTTPVSFNGSYKLLLQKQPGTEANHYKITVNGQVKELDLLEDTEVEIK